MTSAVVLEALAATDPLRTVGTVDGSRTLEWTRTALLAILGYGLLMGAITLVAGFAYRVVTVRELPIGAAALVGLAGPVGWLTVLAVGRGEFVAGSPPEHYTGALFVLGVVAAGTVAATGGRRLGDRIACAVADTRPLETDGRVADRLRSARLSVALTLPESIDDVEGYPPVDETIEQELAGRRLLFPSGFTTAALRSRLETRLETDFDVGYVDAEFAADGTLDALAVGDRRDGIAPTLGPNRVAVAIAGDPPSRASVGDPIEVWTTDGDSRRFVATGRLRASTDSVTTLVVDAADAEAFAPGDRYQLTTRAEPPSGGPALLSAIRGADETVAVWTVEEGGPLEREFVGWLPGTVLVIERDGDVHSLPADNEPLEAGDTIYVFGTPADLEELSTEGVSWSTDISGIRTVGK
ncbi:hypothetical protein RBH26_10685 [Natronolimnohabitans sp. A-GB9]|uniref:hypothetical protein n=1 Tax=Natronolimnohabitans sp. A-GB9 TaxID=3069757 RepID=UPI0027B170B8|nr:hypothetical protein [Natronolimnohabitans sp. A-GB9]MDQ2050947.1 hypothetical protein [Natronolimnohabitans sp. A-GB9]